MSPTLEGAGVALAYSERGSGPAVLLIHDLARDAQGWEPIIARLAAQARVIAYDRRGYGASGAPEPYERTTVYEQAEDAAALLAALKAAPALLAGQGLGALIALDLIVRHRPLAAAAVLVDPPLFAFVPQATEELSAAHEQLLGALREHGPEAAVERWLDGRADPASLRRARAAHGAFFADFAGLTSWPITRAQLRAIDLPVAVLSSAAAPAHLVEAADVLAGLLPRAVRARDADIAAAIEELLNFET